MISSVRISQRVITARVGNSGGTMNVVVRSQGAVRAITVGRQGPRGTSDPTADPNAFVKRNGSLAFTANQSLGGNKLTNLGAPAAGSSDAARISDVEAAVVHERTTVTVDFGNIGCGFVSQIVTGIPWASGSLNYVINPVATDDHSVSDSVLEQMQCSIGEIVNGVGFTVFVSTPGISKGEYAFEVVGV